MEIRSGSRMGHLGHIPPSTTLRLLSETLTHTSRKYIGVRTKRRRGTTSAYKIYQYSLIEQSNNLLMQVIV